ESASAKEYVAHVRLAAQLGFGVCWVPEDLYRGAFTLAAGIASATSKIRIGLGILNPYVRHPATIAMELGALEELSGGRTVLGTGPGLRMWIEGQLGIPYNKPATAMRETIEIVRALFRGGRVDYAGKSSASRGSASISSRPARSCRLIWVCLAPRTLKWRVRLPTD